MQSTGIVRRMDDLGRVVIPKEIRKTLRIKEGDPLEIYTNKEELIFKKFSPIASINSSAGVIARGIANVLDRVCLVLDGDNVICSSDSKNKEIIGAIMSDEMRLLLEKRKVFIACKLDGIVPIKIYRGDENFYDNQIVVPIICNGDVYGALVVYDRDKSKRFSSFDEKVVCLGGDFISSQFDV